MLFNIDCVWEKFKFKISTDSEWLLNVKKKSIKLFFYQISEIKLLTDSILPSVVRSAVAVVLSFQRNFTI